MHFPQNIFNNRLWFAALLFLLFVIGAEFFILFQHGFDAQKSTFTENKNIDGKKIFERKSWGQDIKEMGPKEAHEYFKREQEGKDIGIQHIAAHDFGESLYREIGIEGLTTCDSSFAFGCFHIFFALAVSENGLAVVQELDEACIEKFGFGGQGCQHGIGHGLISYLGPKGNAKALEVCASLQWKKPLFGCQTGVYMEYNFPTKFLDSGGAASSVRIFDPDNPYDPCLSLPNMFRFACLFAQAEWWGKTVSLSNTEIGLLCDGLTDKAERIICFKGIGNGFASSFNFQGAITACEQMPDRPTEILCRAGAYWGFWDSGTYRFQAPQLCSGLSPKEERLCVEEADLPEEGIITLKR